MALAALAAVIVLLAGRAHAQAEQRQCEDAVPGPPMAAKALVLNDTAVEIFLLPPSGPACIEGFAAAGFDPKSAASAAAAPPRVFTGLTTVFANLTPGATYEFDVAAATAARGAGKALTVRAALPPAALDAPPGPPERFRAAAVGAGAFSLSWDAPAGNPGVDGYAITARETDASGWPLPRADGGDDAADPAPTLLALPGQRAATVEGLRPGARYVFLIQALSRRYGGSDPALAFRPAPRDGAGAPPGAPRGLRAAAAEGGEVALSWTPPEGPQPDLYVLTATPLDPATGAPAGPPRALPPAAGGAAEARARGLSPGGRYRFGVRALSLAFVAGLCRGRVGCETLRVCGAAGAVAGGAV